jgi:hypothetical protein
VVADQLAREADQDRCQGRLSRPLCDLPNGRGRGATTDVPGNPVADRPIAGIARASMRSAGIRCDKRRQQRCASMQAKQRVSAPQRSQLAVSTLSVPRRARFCHCSTRPKGRCWSTIIGNPGNVGSRVSWLLSRRFSALSAHAPPKRAGMDSLTSAESLGRSSRRIVALGSALRRGARRSPRPDRWRQGADRNAAPGDSAPAPRGRGRSRHS